MTATEKIKAELKCAKLSAKAKAVKEAAAKAAKRIKLPYEINRQPAKN